MSAEPSFFFFIIIQQRTLMYSSTLGRRPPTLHRLNLHALFVPNKIKWNGPRAAVLSRMEVQKKKLFNVEKWVGVPEESRRFYGKSMFLY